VNTNTPSASLRASLITWYLLGCFLVFGMVVVGGITRLTGSGLSITEWKVITGTIPPLNEAQWIAEFEKYQQIPQYKELNSHFSLSDFKFIYFWEYIHRLFGRLIGVVFLAGFAWFLYKGALKGKLLIQTALMFFLGGIQGFLGWYMVSSGLTNNLYVSHIRLAIHLTFAFITFGYIFYIALTQIFPAKQYAKPAKTSVNVLLGLVLLQIIYGAFVAGLKAGYVYNTWPTMNGEWIPESLNYALIKDGWKSLINNHASVQFIHRILAYIVTIFIFIVGLKSFNDERSSEGVKRAALLLVGIVSLQVILGIGTLLMHVPVWMGVVHQSVAFFLFASVIYYRYRLSE
jgi:cytochrome c oxidase assembly protein subunit 15